MNYYSKSKYVSFCKCKRYLWCDKYHSNEKNEVNNQSVLENGNEIGDLARSYFPNTCYVYSEKNDLNYMVKETARLLNENQAVIAEASFFYLNNYCACDLLYNNFDGTYDLYEVKSTTKMAEYYYDDVSYQLYVLKNCGIKIKHTYLMHVNGFYVFNNQLDIKKYFKIEDITDEVLAKQIEIEENLKLSDDILSSNIAPYADVSKNCMECPFKEYCFKEFDINSDSVLYLYNNRKKYDMFKMGIKTYKDLITNGVTLSDIQKRQIDYFYNDKEEYFNKLEIEKFMNEIKYPIYFLDFESNQYSIPKFNKTKPYSQVCFQYSLHVLDENHNLTHFEFLGDENIDYRLDLVKQLIFDLKKDGTIIAYNSNFEMTRIKEMANIFKEYEEDLLTLIPRFMDLALIFQRGYFYNKAMGNSFSIKSVLPALFPNDESLNYHNLSDVHNGSEAMHTFDNLVNLNETDRNKIRKSLLEYCKLDTYAMVKIYLLIFEKIKK